MSETDMEFAQYFSTLFNPEVEKVPEPDSSSNAGCVKLCEPQFSNSFAVVDDKGVRAFAIDGKFEQSKLFNPSKLYGYRCLHDYLLMRESKGCYEIYFVEMKSNKDTFEHIRHQLQNGIALLAYIQRLCLDRLGVKWPYGRIRFYAAVLFHTEQLQSKTNMEYVQKVVITRKEERRKYSTVKGVYCVENNRLPISELRKHSAEVAYCPLVANAFPCFPSEVAE